MQYFLIIDKSCQNYALTLRPQVSADTIVARPAIPGFAGTCAHPLHLLVSSYVRLAYAEMRLAIEDEGTVHTRTGSQA